MRFVIITVFVLLTSVIIKDKNKSISVFLSLSGICILLFIGVDYIKVISERLSSIVSAIPSSAEYIKLIIKALIITVIAQLVSDICRDNGENALASTAEIVTKSAVIIMVMPLFEAVLSIVNGLIK